MEFVMNEKMKQISLKKSENSLLFNFEKMKDLFSPNFVKIYDCVIISKAPLELPEKQFEKAVNVYGTKTGYEASCTDTYLNYFLENENLDAGDILPLAFLLSSIWCHHLKLIEDTKFCFIVTCEDEMVTMRFHKVRENEGLWLVSDLERYDQPVGYSIV